MTIADIRVNGLKHTREGFLQRVFKPVLDADKQATYALKTAMEELQRATDKLHKFGMLDSAA